MRKIFFIFALFFVTGVVGLAVSKEGGGVFAQISSAVKKKAAFLTTKAEGIFDDANVSFSKKQEIEKLDASNPAVKRIRALRLKPDSFFEKKSSAPTYKPQAKKNISLNLFSNTNVSLRLDEAVQKANGKLFWKGRVDGDPKGQATFLVKGNTIVGHVRTKDVIYEIRKEGDGDTYSVREARWRDFAPHAHLGTLAFSKKDEKKPDEPLERRAAPTSTISLLAYFTRDAAVAAGGDIIDLIELAVEETNQIFENSGIAARIELAREPMSVQYRDTGDLDVDILHLRDRDGEMDYVLAGRENTNADLVTLFVRYGGNRCGIGWVITPDNYDEFEANAFSIVDVDCVDTYALAHEIGHNMGAGHEAGNEENLGLYRYSYGYQNPQGEFRTVMAYRCPDDPDCPIVPYFSNPYLRYNGKTLGTQEANNVLTLNQTRDYVSNFRRPLLINFPIIQLQ